MSVPATQGSRRAPARALAGAGERDVALVDLADRLLDKGVSLTGDLVISLAGVDLVFVSLRALLASVETAMDLGIDVG